ncbi:MAG: TonB-dependent receptor, partial [Gemmatimonadetes bacterium]|nr:TonB-dependent receptor [Gemmatimonadota bacterium]
AVPSATIVMSGGRVTLARVDGRYRLTAPAGRYIVSAQRIGYASARDTVTIRSGETSTLNFKLDRAIAMLEAVSSIGTRGLERTVIDAPVPIDVLSAVDLRATGRTETAQMLQSLAPSITVPRATYAEGSDLIHPFTMRGLGPDQVLVLVNGRRRHTSALLDVNGSTGRGSTGVDLDAIPASMIDHIEIMRDGATAQYGSDAVAGVINVVLKSGVHGDAVTTMGRNATTYNRSDDASAAYPSGERSADDGRTMQASIDKGVVFGARGFLHGDFEIRDHGYTNRSLPDLRAQYLTGDPRANASGLPADLMTHRLGDASSHDLALFLNGGNLFANGLEVYGNVGGSRRTAGAAGVYRTASDFRTILATFPDGFLPVIRPTINDLAGTLGVKGALDEWAWDLSTTYGVNKVAYDVENTEDGGASTQTRFFAGDVRYGQSTTNLDLFRHLDVFDDLRVAAGAELRAESYTIGAGSAPSVFIEGFSGFGAQQVVDRSRHDVAGYLDLETDVSSRLLLGVAGRVENYTDVGTLGSGKLTARFEPINKVALRGSVGQGFRAPSLQQSYYSDAQTDPGTTGLFPWTVLRVDDPQAIALGASTLRAERTTNYSVGVAAEPTSAVSLSVDLYRIDVKDRVVLAESYPLQFSRNGADTRTTGVDVNANYGYRFENSGLLRFTVGANFHDTQLTRDAMAGTANALSTSDVTRIVRGQPRNNILAVANYKLADFGALLRTQRFGEVTGSNVLGTSGVPQTFGAKWITDANVSYTLRRKYTFTAGADNLFDVYPDRNSIPGGPTGPFNPAANGYFGIYPYSGTSPFGFNGRFVYGRLSIYL